MGIFRPKIALKLKWNGCFGASEWPLIKKTYDELTFWKIRFLAKSEMR